MAYTAILKRIRLLIPAKLDGHYESIRCGFEGGFNGSKSVNLGNGIGSGDFGIHQLSSK
jgi:hypothetical protein